MVVIRLWKSFVATNPDALQSLGCNSSHTGIVHTPKGVQLCNVQYYTLYNIHSAMQCNAMPCKAWAGIVHTLAVWHWAMGIVYYNLQCHYSHSEWLLQYTCNWRQQNSHNSYVSRSPCYLVKKFRILQCQKGVNYRVNIRWRVFSPISEDGQTADYFLLFRWEQLARGAKNEEIQTEFHIQGESV